MSQSLASPKKRLKSQVDEDDDDDCCGICYVERGVTIAGEIDSCNHYFCFVCIMEWSKHESRCPICRQRFAIVRRLPMDGVFSSSRDVKVPLRDQVYHPYGNMTAGPANSLAEVKCCICLTGKDEALLLRCDLCDIASHAYCVGLGYSVPEGDWFCHDCAISQETIVNEESDQQNVEPTAKSSVTICDIVRGTGNQVVRRSSASPLQQNQSSTSVIPLCDRVSRLKGKRPALGAPHVQRNLETFRENWNALRSGSLQFHCNSLQSVGSGSQKQGSSSSSRGNFDNLNSLVSNNTLNERGSYNVDKAWKMMDKAKMMQLTHLATGSVRLGVDKTSCSGGARKISLANCNYPEMKNLLPRTLDIRYPQTEKQSDCSRFNKNLENHRSSKFGGKRPSRVTCEEVVPHMRNHTTTHSEGYREYPLSRKLRNSNLGVPCREDGERNVAKEQSGSACIVGSATSHGNFGTVLSNRDADLFIEEKKPAKSFGDKNTKKLEDAKDEIRSLVKLNLKFLTREKKLGVETFKVVARHATHTILNACCSKQQKSSSSSVCSHADQTNQFQKSSIMSNCCQQCFYAFVNNVVNSSMLEKSPEVRGRGNP